jgi:hypothetical protein
MKARMSEKGDDNRDMDDVQRVDTVPPPPGEDDAYSAPTRLHSAPPEAVLSAMKEATKFNRPLKPVTIPKPEEGPNSSSRPKATPVPDLVEGEDDPGGEWLGTGEVAIKDDVTAPEAAASSADGPPSRLAIVKTKGRVELSLSAVVGIAATFVLLLIVLTLLLFR